MMIIHSVHFQFQTKFEILVDRGKYSDANFQLQKSNEMSSLSAG